MKKNISPCIFVDLINLTKSELWTLVIKIEVQFSKHCIFMCVSDGEIPFPRLRDQSTTSKKNVIQAVEIDQDVLIANLEQVFDKIVRGSIRKLKNSPSELPEYETTASWPYGTSRKKLIKLSPSPLDRWKSFLNSNFDRINKDVGIQWSSKNDEKEDKKNTEAENNDDDDGSNHGITSVPLSSVLRPGLPEDYIEIFEETLGSTQELISDDISNLSAVIRATMLEFVAKNAEYVVRILSRLYLAPKREAYYKELVSRKAKEKQELKIKVDSAAIRNFQRNRFREEKKYLQKTENRIVQAKDSDEEEKWSSRRYKFGNDVTEQDITEICCSNFELQSQEIQAVKTIVNLLRPFVRESNGKKHRSIADALPIVVFANTVLTICGYQEFTTQISPLVSGQDNDNIDIEALKTKIAELKAAYKLQQKEWKRSIRAYEEAKSSLVTESLDILRDLRLKRAQAITDAENTATRLKDMRMMLYNITRSLKKKATGRDQEKAENTNKPLPTLRHYACEESRSNIDISVLEKEAFDAGKTLGYSGTDYALRTMSTTVAMSQKKLQYHISLYNRFAALDDTELDGNMAPDTTAESPDTNDGGNFIAYVATSRFNCITAAQINEKSLCNKHTRLRQKRKSKTKPFETLKSE
ncbi:hypothetical protein VTP01DRAFT_4200 [Rhizomucor pusillus]|uniref:uncharacterized protein n=1 Tax=Rhizomucor pusillus TaxID=4840 RepID=UPI00374234F7